MKQTYFWAIVLLGSILGVATSCSNGGKSTTRSSGSSSSSGSGGLTTKLMGGAVQGTALSLAGTASTLAATFTQPTGITTDGTSLYVADNATYSIYKVVPSTGTATTLAGGTMGIMDGTGTAAGFVNPGGITSDGSNVYVVDAGASTIRKIVISSGAVTTLAGVAGAQGDVDGAGTVAEFKESAGITTDNTNLYVADSGNCAIRQVVISTGAVSTVAGSGTCASTGASVNGTSTAATFVNPFGITTDGTSLYVTDYQDNTVRKINIATQAVTTLAGTAGTSGASNGTSTAATFNAPSFITTDGTNLYVGEDGNDDVRKIVISTGVVTTLAGTAGDAGSTNGSSPLFAEPWFATSLGGKLYLTEFATNNDVRVIQ